MCIFDMVVSVGMCPHSCMMNDVFCVVTCVDGVLVSYRCILLSLQDV